MPPPAKVLAEAEVRLMVPVPVTVRLVEGLTLKTEPATVNTPDPSAMVLCVVYPESKEELVLLKVTL